MFFNNYSSAAKKALCGASVALALGAVALPSFAQMSAGLNLLTMMPEDRQAGIVGEMAPAKQDALFEEMYRLKKYDLIKSVSEPLSKKGSASALYFLALLNANGQGMPKNEAAAVPMFMQSAAAGAPAAMLHSGLNSMYGKNGFTKNEMLAVKYLKPISDRSEMAAFEMGIAHEEGKGGLTPSDEAASEIYEKFKWKSFEIQSKVDARMAGINKREREQNQKEAAATK
jgi:hypothetical protein